MAVLKLQIILQVRMRDAELTRKENHPHRS